MGTSISQDLWKRRVPHFVGAYLGVSWAVVEFTAFLVDRYLFSPHLVTLSLVILASLLPSVMIIAYFHGAPGRQGWSKTEKVTVPTNLLALVVVLGVMFSGKDLGASTTSVAVTNEEGVTTERIIPKSEFRKRLAVFYFDSEATNQALDWYEYGIPTAIEVDLTQDLYFQTVSADQFVSDLQERGYPDGVGLPLTLRRELASEVHAPYFVSGSFSSAGEELSIAMTLHETERGKLLAEHVFSGGDLFEIVDEMTVQLKHDLHLPEQYIEETEDLPVRGVLTESMPSFEQMIRGSVALILRSDWENSASYLGKSVEEDKTNALAHLLLYRVSILGNDREKAEAAIQGAMQHLYRLPERIQFQVKISYYDFLQQPEKVIAVSRMSVELSPEDILGRVQLATLLKLRNLRDEAIEQYEAILEIDPSQHGFLKELGELHQVRGDFEEAISYYQEYAAHYPEDLASYASLGDLSRLTGAHEQAREYYDRAQLIEPANISILVGSAILERSFGNFDEELAQLNRALQLAKTSDDRARVLGALGRAYAYRGMLAKSVESMEEELAELEPTMAPVPFMVQRLSSLGRYVEAGRPDEAERVFAAVTSELRPPFDPLSSLGRMAIAIEMQDADGAESVLAVLEEFIQAFGVEALRPRVLRTQGRIHEARGEWEEALRSYEAQLEFDYTAPEVKRAIGRCHRELGDLNAAEEYLNEARKAVPSDPRALYELALVSEALGDSLKAIQRLEEALRVWENADPGFVRARLAREKLADLNGDE